MAKNTVTVNRAPVPTLWAAVIAERLGFDADAALTLGKAVAGLNVQAKGRRLGIFKPPRLAEGERPKKYGLGEDFWVELYGRAAPAKNTKDGVRAVVKDQAIDPQQVSAYLNRAFGEDLAAVCQALEQLAASREVDALANEAFAFHERFHPPCRIGGARLGTKGRLGLGTD